MIVKKLLNDVRVMKRTGESVKLADFKASNENDETLLLSNENDEAWMLSYSSDKAFSYLILLEFANIKDEELQYFYDYMLCRDETLMVTRTTNRKGVYALIYVKQYYNFISMQNTYLETLCDNYKERFVGHFHIDKRVFYSNNHLQIWKEDDCEVTAFDWDVNTEEDEKDVTETIKYYMKIVEECGTPETLGYIEGTEIIYRCASAEKYGIVEAYDFCKYTLITRPLLYGSYSYYKNNINEFEEAWKYAINTTIAENYYKCNERQIWWWCRLAYGKK